MQKRFSEYLARDLVAHAAYGIYWEIIEYLHENTLKVDEVEMLSDVLRVDSDVIEKILNEYDLFKIVDGAYISERVLRNLKLQEEKSQKARASVNKRHNKNKQDKQGETPEENKEAPEYDEEFVMSIVQIYNDKFKTTRIVSKANKEKIFKIHTENNLTLEVWSTIFSNAKRGWDIGDKKNVAPTLKKILEEWDSFASNDYFLAPDREAIARANKEAEIQKAKQQQEEQLQRAEWQKKHDEKLNAIENKETALDYLYCYAPNLSENFLRINRSFKVLSNEYKFTLEELMEYIKERGERKIG